MQFHPSWGMPPYMAAPPPFDAVPIANPSPASAVETPFKLATAEESEILKQAPLGRPMDLEEFVRAFFLGTIIKNVMVDLDVDSPEMLSSIPFELYMAPKEKSGFGLPIGAAIKLKRAIIAWVEGKEKA
jgi:hypothetical protein